MSSLDLEPQPRVLQFPGGGVVKAKPSRASLENSLQAWAAVAVLNAQSFRDDPTAINLGGLKSSLRVIEQTLAELAAYDQPIPECMR